MPSPSNLILVVIGIYKRISFQTQYFQREARDFGVRSASRKCKNTACACFRFLSFFSFVFFWKRSGRTVEWCRVSVSHFAAAAASPVYSLRKHLSFAGKMAGEKIAELIHIFL